MNVARAAIAAAVLMMGVWANLNPDIIDDWIDVGIAEQTDDPIDLVGLQSDERWLVLRVQFPDRPFSQDKADSMLGGENSAADYIDQISGGTSTLSVSMQGGVWTAPHAEGHWGADASDERDIGATALVEEACKAMLEGQDLSNWDFNGDGSVDRLLVLHSGRAQETGGGANSLWSHMSWLDEALPLGEWSVNHYTMASLDSGIGTVVHEMLHQMRALDLYDVHSELPSSNWNGLGDWDIMASGNWNGNGDIPALPGSATLDLIGAHRSISVNPLVGGSFEMSPISAGGRPLSIEIAPGETLWVTFRGDIGFDAALPGHGILVEHQDENNGNSFDNLVNTDPDTAWVKIIEADGDAALERGRDTGSPGDVFSEADIFGSDGMIIRDNRGRMVQWTATVESLGENTATVLIQPSGQSDIDVLTPRNPIQLISGESSYAQVTASQPCTLEVSLSWTQGGGQIQPDYIDIPSGTYQVEILHSPDGPSDHGSLRGTIGCEGESLTDIDIDWFRVGHRLGTTQLETVVAWDSTSTVHITPDYEGDGERTYSISVEGAADRIASATSPITLSAGDSISLDIDPAGLLEPGMLARGELVLSDSNGIEQRIPLLLEAESPFSGNGWLAWLSQPSNGLLVISALVAISIVSGGRADVVKPPPRTE